MSEDSFHKKKKASMWELSTEQGPGMAHIRTVTLAPGFPPCVQAGQDPLGHPTQPGSTWAPGAGTWAWGAGSCP